MKHLTRFSGLLAALCLSLPAAGFADSHGGHGGWSGGHGGGNWSHGNWHGGNWHNGYCYSPRVHFFGGYSPFFYSYYPYYYPYYGGYCPSPSIGLSISSSSAYHGDHADDLAIDVQRALRHAGYYHGSIDGDIGAGTRAAIRQFQFDHHLEVTGRIDRSLLRSLGLD
jgi:hypothetical protein